MRKPAQPVISAVSPRTVILICAALVVITWAVFGQTLGHEFVNYDDQTYVYENAEVTSGLTGHGIIWAFTSSHSFNWHPLTWISHMLDCQIFGLKAGGHHFTNVLLHTIAVVLLFLVLRQMTSALWRSAFVAAVFAVHPLHVESVAWVAERKDVLSAVFFFLTLGAYVRYVRRRSPARYFTVLFLFALGLMSKPMLVTVPALLLLLDYWPLNRLAHSSSAKSIGKRSHIGNNSWANLILEKVPLFALSIASCVVTLIAQKHAIVPIEQMPLAFRLSNALRSGALYLWQMIFPCDLVPLYPLTVRSTALSGGLAGLTILVVITLVVFFWRRKHPYALTGWLWYLIMILPILGIVQVGSQAHADRYTYLPQIGLCLLVAWTIADLSVSWPRRREILFAASGLVIAVLAGMAWKQTSYWRNNESLWRHSIAVTPDNSIAFTNLGDALLQKGRFDDAIAPYQKALELRPNDPDAHNGLGSAFLRKGLSDQAIDHYRQAVALRPQDPEAHNNYGSALCQKGLIDDGIVQYEKALELRPDRADIYTAETQLNLANALLRKGRSQEAIAHYHQALEIQPNSADTHDNLATALLRQGMAAEAMGQYQNALELNSRSASVQSDFAWALATCFDASFRNGPKAVELAEQARSLTGGKDPVILRTLAAAYAESGQFSEAIATAHSALELANVRHNARLIKTLEKEIALYQSNSPYHEVRR